MSQVSVDTVAVAALKFLLYEDEIEGSWDTFIDGPLRYIASKIPRLRLCQQPQCSCPHWHNAEGVKPMKPYLMFGDANFSKAPFDLTLPARCCSSTSFMQVELLAAAAHQALKPEAIFLPAGPKLEFLAGPFPFGSDRNSLLRAFRALKWEARPLQPLSSIDTKGSMWLVQATEDPPDSILPMSHGDVVVTRHKKPREVKDPKPRPVASADTLALCGNNGTDGSKDPWLPSDPWGGFKATTHTLVAADATAGLKQLEDKVTQAVLSSLPAQQVGKAEVEVEEAEAQMNQIRALMSKRSREDHESSPLFRKSLRMSKSKFSHCVAGAPVPLRLRSQLSGGWKGVAAIAKHPTRAMPAALSDEVRLSSRALVTATFLNGLWITMGTIYGESAGTWHPDQLANNDRLLSEVATQICVLSSGLRVIAGDFNNGEFDLPSFQILEMHGFKDLQTLAFDRWGIEMQMTCKCSTRVDFCYISPELQALLTKVHVDQTIWPDHAVISGVFHGGVRSVPRYVWRLPQPMTWPAFEVEPLGSILPGHATAKYTEMWRHAEHRALEASAKPVRAACLGRATTLAPRKTFGQAHAPLRAAREGDILPQFFGTSLQHALWSPDLTFQDIKQAGPDNVDLLIRPEQAKVVAIDGSQLCLQLNRDLCWDPQKSVYCGAARIEVIHHEAFQHTWTQRWCRHDKVPNSQWDDILAFASRVVRPAPCKLVEVDHSLLGEEIRCKRRRTSKGLDGVSILDLKAAPASLRTNICLFYKDATETGEWPIAK
ncbi:unnamed protein product [Cladocopium goreaui]|uniref:Uncharacterized protein n=1 Tax=Cladocopium goreaui TaxID=2562237 RepID=A0A9P1G419_9DINO|nr:unnamed protein product [Cladocopium goreaui]